MYSICTYVCYMSKGGSICNACPTSCLYICSRAGASSEPNGANGSCIFYARMSVTCPMAAAYVTDMKSRHCQYIFVNELLPVLSLGRLTASALVIRTFVLCVQHRQPTDCRRRAELIVRAIVEDADLF